MAMLFLLFVLMSRDMESVLALQGEHIYKAVLVDKITTCSCIASISLVSFTVIKLFLQSERYTGFKDVLYIVKITLILSLQL